MAVSLPQGFASLPSQGTIHQQYPIPMRPSGATKALACYVKSVTTSAVVNIVVPSGATFATINSEDYGCHYKWKTATDADDCEATDGGKWLGRLVAGGESDEVVISGATYLSLRTARGTAYVTVAFR